MKKKNNGTKDFMAGMVIGFGTEAVYWTAAGFITKAAIKINPFLGVGSVIAAFAAHGKVVTEAQALLVLEYLKFEAKKAEKKEGKFEVKIDGENVEFEVEGAA